MPPGETARLLERAREGSEEALEALYAHAARRLLPLIRIRLGPSLRSRLESRDILQDVLARSLPRLAEVRNEHPGSFLAWLGRIAENEIRDRVAYHRRQRRDGRREVGLEDAAELRSPLRSALSGLVLDEQALRLEAALEALAPEQREAVLLRRFEELPFAEVGRRLGRSEDAARMLYARAMSALTLRLGGRG